MDLHWRVVEFAEERVPRAAEGHIRSVTGDSQNRVGSDRTDACCRDVTRESKHSDHFEIHVIIILNNGCFEVGCRLAGADEDGRDQADAPTAVSRSS